MKTLATIIYLLAGIATPLMAGIEQVKIEIKYKGVEAKWFSDITSSNKVSRQDEEGTVKLPSVIAKPGEEATIEIIRELPTVKDKPEGLVVPCGVILKFTPMLGGDGLSIIGKSILRRSTNKDSEGMATRFETQEVFLNLRLESGVPEIIELDNGGQMFVAATVIDATGRPVKN